MNGNHLKKDCEADVCNEKVVNDSEFKVSAWGHRHQQCLVLLFTLTIAYSMRACMGVALVGMVENIHVLKNTTENYTQINGSEAERNNTEENCLNVDADDYEAHGFLNALMLTPPYPQFNWDKKIQDMAIASFFIGYMLLQIPAGMLTHRFGSKTLITVAMGINCLVSLLFPTLSYYGGWVLACLCRIIQGLSQAVIVPSMHSFLGKWTRLEERGRLSSIVYGGQAFGAVLGLPMTGFIAASPLGWPGIFRFYGVLSGIVAAVVHFVCADSPAQHRKISPAERNYIEESLGQSKTNKRLSVPWVHILRSKGMWAIITAHVGNTWGQLILYSEVPSYMDKIMRVNIKANGVLTALPFLVMWFTNFFFSWFFDMLIVKKYVTVTISRKIANSVGAISASSGLILLAFSNKNIYVVETILVFICAFKISAHVGFMVNHIDISPNFAGTMMSISNFVSNAIGCLAPIVTGIILTDSTSQYMWRKVFFISSGLYFFTNLVYVIFGTSELADWNEPEDKKENEEVPMIKKVDIKKE